MSLNMNKKLFENIMELKEKLEDETEKLEENAFRILKEINAIKKIDGMNCLELFDFNEVNVHFKGHEDFYCRSRDDYQFSFPSDILYDEDKKNLYFEKMICKVNSENLILEKSKQDAIKRKEELDFKKYNELKKQFENK